MRCGVASLFIVSGEKVDYYPLGQHTTVVGRDEAASIQVLDTRASRKHVQIRYDRQRESFIALDMRSKNGTFINGRRIQDETILSDGDQIQIGDTTILFTVKDFPGRKSALDNFKQAGQRRFTTHVDPPS
jgi:pSer/pThr/pTyr-binding forkhead associated (FHA) protein